MSAFLQNIELPYCHFAADRRSAQIKMFPRGVQLSPVTGVIVTDTGNSSGFPPVTSIRARPGETKGGDLVDQHIPCVLLEVFFVAAVPPNAVRFQLNIYVDGATGYTYVDDGFSW